MSDTELVVRLIVFLPLAFIAYQVIMLRLMLPEASRAWTKLAVGFALFAALRALLLFTEVPVIPAIIVTIVGFSFIGSGFHTMRNDLRQVLQSVPGNQQRRAD